MDIAIEIERGWNDEEREKEREWVREGEKIESWEEKNGYSYWERESEIKKERERETERERERVRERILSDEEIKIDRAIENNTCFM